MSLNQKNTLVLVVDIQERLMPVLYEATVFAAACRRLLTGAELLELPVIVTEQYPKGLGQTIADIRLASKDAPVFEKTRFSAYTEEVQAALKDQQVENIIVIGCETHICILQTTLDLQQAGYQVYLPQECVTSRILENKDNGLNQAQQAGAIVSNIESLLFQILQDAKHPQFKAISKLIQ
ncbi:MAG: isochorismatase family protein [Alysiella sp.]|uniref:isochorismatase family protein n=1 Tax=Alysiella sp. TaxID=1872483 RepID=UPI0026DB0E27|nr:isochorismatase family protein [Alysiella sp.]MDO4434420.1 isochorismatase family protein [Alysiella sp.]